VSSNVSPSKRGARSAVLSTWDAVGARVGAAPVP
jgi:hypothetical protein